MSRALFRFIASAATGIILFHPAVAEVTLPKIFGSGMVLQRNMPVPVWGKADPGEKIAITLEENFQLVQADEQGNWQVRLSPMPAGGPYVMTIKGENHIEFEDVMIGDVWLCGGQSNMQWQVHQTGYEEMDESFMKNAPVRLFTVEIATDYNPRENLKGTGWQRLNTESIARFSAVAYHFGKYVNSELDVPVGLISDNLGATSVETWMSYQALSPFPQFGPEINPFMELGKSVEEINEEFEKSKGKWYHKKYYKGPGIDEKWYLPETDISAWGSMEVSGNTWKDTDLEDHDGAVWFRKSFDLPGSFSGEFFHLNLSQIDDYDIVWINGQKVGETYGRHNHRNYQVPASLLKPKGNVLVIRVFDAGGIGGFTTSSFWGNPILWGKWKYKKGLTIKSSEFKLPLTENITPFSTPSALFNGSIAPLIPFAIKGVIWYQGESNADRAHEYRELFPALITDWRKKWGQGDFPFLFTQLANYQQETEVPQESDWAELREAQALALTLPNTGMAVAIDIGEADDIHPKNKEAVGKRLGIAAMKVAYGKKVVFSGPTLKSMKIENDKISIEFENTGSGLISRDKYGYVRGFQVAGNDKKFHWAKAFIEDDKVIVRSEKVNDPIAVRYAWSANPGELDLYNMEGLPAVPFRSDDWEGVTFGKKFDAESPRF